MLSPHHFKKVRPFLSYSVSYYSDDDVSKQAAADHKDWDGDLYTEGWVTDIAKRGNLQPGYMELIVCTSEEYHER